MFLLQPGQGYRKSFPQRPEDAVGFYRFAAYAALQRAWRSMWNKLV